MAKTKSKSRFVGITSKEVREHRTLKESLPNTTYLKLNEDGREWLTVAKAAMKLHVTTPTIYNYIKSGKLDGVVLHNQIIVATPK